jgi:hypothetical protein
LTDTKTRLRKSLKSIYDDLSDAENGPDRTTFGFKHRLEVIHENLVELEPNIISEFPELGDLDVISDFKSLHYTKGDSGMAQLLKSRIKKIAIAIDADLEQDYPIIDTTNHQLEQVNETNQNFVTSSSFGSIIRLNNRELNAIFFQTPKEPFVKINSVVNETGLDMGFKLMVYDEYLKLKQYWDAHPANPKNPSGVYAKTPTKPQIEELFSRRTNIIDQHFDLVEFTKYAWVLDNTYSRIQDKTVTTKIEIQTKTTSKSKSNLPIVNLLKTSLPKELFTDLNDANDCYLQDHNRQSAIMFRKALETAIKLKILQARLNPGLLLNKDGNELRLSEKLDLLVTENLISPKIKGDIDDTIKWFGDSGVHTKMPIVSDDVRHNIEPKFRKFLTELNLTV